MQNNAGKDLSSCLSSFVPLFLSIPFVFLYYLHRLSIVTSIFFISCLFLVHFIVLNRFYSKQVFLRAHFLTFVLLIGVIWSFASPAIGLFTIVLSIFHLSEYISVGFWCPRTLTLNSFLLNHSPQYHGAIFIAYLEYFIEKYFLFPNGFPYQSLMIMIGLAVIFSGEYLRKLAMYTAQQSFSHLIEDKPNAEHRLITNGIYSSYRHPSYVGWFWWSCGTQILLANPICFFIYLIASWWFFADRIAYEEATLIRYYGERYRDYQKRVPVGIPFIKGYKIYSIDNGNVRRNSRASIISIEMIDVDSSVIFSVVALAFLASMGLTLLILGCALSGYNWWPTFVIIFYVLCPIPISIGRRCASSSGYGVSESTACSDLVWFITSVIVVSAFGLPSVLYRSGAIIAGSMGFVMAANTVVFSTIALYFLTFGADDNLLLA